MISIYVLHHPHLPTEALFDRRALGMKNEMALGPRSHRIAHGVYSVLHVFSHHKF